MRKLVIGLMLLAATIATTRAEAATTCKNRIILNSAACPSGTNCTTKNRSLQWSDIDANLANVARLCAAESGTRAVRVDAAGSGDYLTLAEGLTWAAAQTRGQFDRVSIEIVPKTGAGSGSTAAYMYDWPAGVGWPSYTTIYSTTAPAAAGANNPWPASIRIGATTGCGISMGIGAHAEDLRFLTAATHNGTTYPFTTATGNLSAFCNASNDSWSAENIQLLVNIQDAATFNITGVAISGTGTGVIVRRAYVLSNVLANPGTVVAHFSTAGTATLGLYESRLAGDAKIDYDSTGTSNIYGVRFDTTATTDIDQSAGTINCGAGSSPKTIVSTGGTLNRLTDAGRLFLRVLAAAPSTCDASTSVGESYIDTTGNDLCFCPGAAGWLPADGTGTCA